MCIQSKVCLFRRSTGLLLLTLITISAAWAANNWGDAPADLTISEYLELQFKLGMTRPESDALNSFSLVSFYPSSNPQDALVVVIQTWRLSPMCRAAHIRWPAQVFHTVLTPVGKGWRRETDRVTCVRTTSTLPAFLGGLFLGESKEEEVDRREEERCRSMCPVLVTGFCFCARRSQDASFR